jgi:tetratricopeptide (TPR) repeat protein
VCHSLLVSLNLVAVPIATMRAARGLASLKWLEYTGVHRTHHNLFSPSYTSTLSLVLSVLSSTLTFSFPTDLSTVLSAQHCPEMLRYATRNTSSLYWTDVSQEVARPSDAFGGKSGSFENPIANERLDPRPSNDLAALQARRQYARAVARQGRHSEARVIQLQLIRDFDAQFGNASLDALETMSDLVCTHQAECHYKEAEALAVELLALQRTTFGDGAPTTLATGSMIACALHSQGKYLEESKLRRRILNQRKREATLEDFPRLAEAFATYGRSLFKLEKYDEARVALEDGLYMYTLSNWNGDLDLDVLACGESLAKTLLAQGLRDRAIALGTRVLHGRRGLLGQFHADTISSMSDLATCLCHSTLAQRSKEMIKNAMGMSAKYLGTEHFTTISIWLNGATIFRKLGDLEVARALAHRSLALSEQAKGTDHPDTLSAISEVCWTLQRDRRFSTARDYMALCVQHTAQFYGWTHPLTLRRSRQLHDLHSLASMHRTRETLYPIRALFKAALLRSRARQVSWLRVRA